MKRAFIFISLFLLAVSFAGFSQSSASISKPELAMDENRISIQYDILNSGQNEKFNISLEVTDADGKRVMARTLSGDLGTNVKGGAGKMINWDLEADNVYVEAMLYFQVNASPVTSRNTSEARSTNPGAAIVSGSISRSGVVLQSLLLPGLGLSRTTGKPHWVRGVLGYGCVLSTVGFKISSDIKYDKYTQTTDIDERGDLFEQSANQAKVSKIQLGAAIGIWAIDFIWNIAGTKDLSNKFVGQQSKGFSIQPSYDPLENVPLLAFKYNF